MPQKDYFRGLFGVFADSLPDAWGNILLNRMLRKNRIDPARISILDRLAVIGSSGMGALGYQPEYEIKSSIGDWNPAGQVSGHDGGG